MMTAAKKARKSHEGVTFEVPPCPEPPPPRAKPRKARKPPRGKPNEIEGEIIRDGPSTGTIYTRTMRVVRKLLALGVEEDLAYQVRFLSEWAYGRGVIDGRSASGHSGGLGLEPYREELREHTYVLARAFLEKNKPTSRAATVREILPAVSEKASALGIPFKSELERSDEWSSDPDRPKLPGFDTVRTWLKENAEFDGQFDPGVRAPFKRASPNHVVGNDRPRKRR